MKRIILVAATIVFMGILITGCGSQNVTVTSAQEQEEKEEETSKRTQGEMTFSINGKDGTIPTGTGKPEITFQDSNTENTQMFGGN